MSGFDACAWAGNCSTVSAMSECRACMVRRVITAERRAIAKDLREQAPGYGLNVRDVMQAIAMRIERGVRG